MKLYKLLLIILIIVLIGGITTFIDYKRVNNNQKPVYVLSNYNSKSKKQIYNGIFYKIERECNNSEKEKISESKQIVFKFFGIKLKLNKIINPKENIKIMTKEQNKCSNSKLEYADKKIKIYTYCIDEIIINSYGKNYSLKEYIKNNNYKNILKELRFNGTTIDKNSLELIDINKVTNFGLKVIECKVNNNNDIYLGPNYMTYQEDFCTNKDDDFSFMWTIIDKHDENFKCPENSEKEILYEDNENIYTFDCLKSDSIFVNTPAIRGKIEQNIPIKEALTNNLITINEAINRGLKINTEKRIT